MNGFYKQFDELYLEIEKFLNNYGKSRILQDHFIEVLNSLFYANLINNFFTNLNKENVKKINLPRGKIGQIKSKYKDIRKDTRLSLSLRHKKIDKKCYEDFTLRLRKDFPEFQKITQEIERIIGFEEAKDYLNRKATEIRDLGKQDIDLDGILITGILEQCISRGEYLPIGKKKIDKLMKALVRKIVPQFSEEVIKTLNTACKEMLDYQRKIQEGFENRLYKTWEEPLDLLEALIRISLEAKEKQKTKLNKIVDEKNCFIHGALIRIHARALQISNEILVLLKAGYADGANSRWRSLHELAVISFFLCDNSNEVSKRYLEHEIIRKFKEARDYGTYYKKLGYLPISRKEFNRIKKEKEKLCEEYGDRFQDDYGWIPISILSNRNFRALEEYVKLNKLRPFYNLACDAVHGGAKGFYRLGLMEEYQNTVLLVGPSSYGLADPMQNTAISLSHITVCLLNLKSDFENMITMQVILSFVKDIGKKAAGLLKLIEDEEAKKNGE